MSGHHTALNFDGETIEANRRNCPKGHDFPYAEALGGYWIRADGSVIPVLTPEHHTHTLEVHGMGSCHVRAYKAGWARVTFCGREEFGATFRGTTSVEALRTLVKLIRSYATYRRRFTVEERERYHYDHRSGYTYSPNILGEGGGSDWLSVSYWRECAVNAEGARNLASKLMKLTLEVSAKRKAEDEITTEQTPVGALIAHVEANAAQGAQA